MDQSAIDGLYDAIADPSDWPGAMDRFAHAVGAKGCLFYPTDPTHQAIPCSTSLEGFIKTFIRDGWYLKDPRADRGWPRGMAGQAVILEHDIASDDERRRLPYYQELLRNFDLPWWAAIIFSVNGLWWAVPMLRGAAAGAFSRDEADELSRLVPDVRRVINLAQKASATRTQTALSALDQIGCAAAILTKGGKVRGMNVAAERLLDGVMQVRNGYLTASDPALRTRLTEFTDRRDTLSKKTDTLRAVLGKSVMVIEYFALFGRLRDVFHDGDGLFTITDVTRPRAIPATVLTQAFGLAPAEAALAVRVGQGDTIEEAADALNVTIGTARTRLKAVFSKTSVSRQAELVGLLGRLKRSE